MANVRLLWQVEADLEQAVAWYESRSRQAAALFQREIASAMVRIADMPEMYALCDERHRLCPIRKSQYILVYRFEQAADEVVVVALAHAKRDPKKWQPGTSP